MTYSVRSLPPQGLGSRRARSAFLGVFTAAGILLGSDWARDAWVRACAPGAECLSQTLQDSLFPVATRVSISALLGFLVGYLVWSLALHLDRG